MFLLEKLTSQLRSDVLSDGAISAKSGLAMQHSVRFNEQLVLTRKSVFAAFGAAGAGRKPQPLRDLNGKTVRAKVWVDKEGHGYVQIKKQSIRFEFGGLTTSDTAQRVAFAETVFKCTRLQANTASTFLHLQKSRASPSGIFRDCRVAGVLAQTICCKLNQKLIEAHGLAELIPEDVRYWENLSAILKVSRAWSSSTEMNSNVSGATPRARSCGGAALISLAFPLHRCANAPIQRR